MLSKEKRVDFEKLSKKVSDFIKENYDPHTTVIITDSHIKIVRDEIGIPVERVED